MTASDSRQWFVSDERAEALVPDGGFIHDYVEYMKQANDAPLWYHIGAILTAMGVASGKRDIRIIRRDGGLHHPPMHLWSAIIGTSADRKSGALDPVQRLLYQVNPPSMMATDASVEAWHDQLSDAATAGIGVMYHDELSYLFDQAKRSYSSSLVSWLLTTYKGGPVSRSTKSGGFVNLPRVRLSILGAIPPRILQESTTRNDWSRGFLPRFCLWGGRRTRYLELQSEDRDLEEELSRWMRAICWGHDATIVMPSTVTVQIADWFYDTVEKKRDSYPEDLFSALARLQEKALKLATLFCLSEVPKLDDKPIYVKPHHGEQALGIVRELQRTTSGLFSLVSSTEEATTENRILDYIVRHPGARVPELAEVAGLSRRKVLRTLEALVLDGSICKAPIITEETSGPGRRKMGYFLT